MRILALLFFLHVTCAAQESHEPAIDSIATKELDAGSVGLTIGVARGDEVIHLKGYGKADIELDVPASEKSVYRIGSITKMFTAGGHTAAGRRRQTEPRCPTDKIYTGIPGRSR